MPLGHFCTPENALVVRNISSLYIKNVFKFVKPRSKPSFVITNKAVTIVMKID
jgi:hypothetical protein